MAGTRDYPLAGVLGAGNLIHHARLVGLLGKRIETRCGLEGDKTGRDGGTWCPECVALERAEADAHDERGPFRNDLRTQLVTAGTEAAEQWLAVRANRKMSDVNRRRLAGHVVNALWTEIERAAVEMAQYVGDEQLAAATARAEKAEALRREDVAAARRERDEAKAETVKLNAYLTLVVARYGNQTFYERDVKRAAELSAALAPDAAPDGRSEPVERSETSGGIGTASNSSTGTAGLSAACGNKYSYHVCFLPAGHDGDHRDDRYWRWPTHLGTWTSDDATEDGQHG